jgi:hypothetical protein
MRWTLRRETDAEAEAALDALPSREPSPFEPDDAIGRDGRTAAESAADPIIEPPPWRDELDLAAVFLRPAPEHELEAGG